jgi:hypothetical protein
VAESKVVSCGVYNFANVRSDLLEIVDQENVPFAQLSDVKVFPGSLQQLRQGASQIALVFGFFERRKRHRLVAIDDPESDDGILKK